MDELIGLNENITLWCADDIAILIGQKFPNIVPELLEEPLSTLQQWCDQIPLSINPQEMVTVPFTEDRDLKGLKELILSRHTLQLI
jgi:hypothetical protein